MDLKSVISLQNSCLVKLASHLFSLKMVPEIEVEDDDEEDEETFYRPRPRFIKPSIDEEVLEKLELYILPPLLKIKLKNILCYMKKWLQDFRKKDQVLFGNEPDRWFPSASRHATGGMDVRETIRTVFARHSVQQGIGALLMEYSKFELYCEYCVEEDQISDLILRIVQQYSNKNLFCDHKPITYYFLANKIPSSSLSLKNQYQALIIFGMIMSSIIRERNIAAFNYFWTLLPRDIKINVLKGKYGTYAPFMRVLLAHNVWPNSKTIKRTFTKNLIEYYLDMWLWYEDRFLDVLEAKQSLLSDKDLLELFMKIINVMKIYVVIDDLLRIFDRFWLLYGERIAKFNPWFSLSHAEMMLINSDGKDRLKMITLYSRAHR